MNEPDWLDGAGLDAGAAGGLAREEPNRPSDDEHAATPAASAPTSAARLTPAYPRPRVRYPINHSPRPVRPYSSRTVAAPRHRLCHLSHPKSGLPDFGIIEWSKSETSDFDAGEVDAP